MNAPPPRNVIVSLSGGKDSTAMLLMALDRGIKIHSAVYCDMGPWEFPQMHDHIDRLEADIAPIPLVRVRPKYDPVFSMTERPIKRRSGGMRYGDGWPSPLRRWCTSRKIRSIASYLKTIPGAVSWVGIAADEWHRTGRPTGKKEAGCSVEYPLIDWGVAESDALEYCLSRGYDWSGLYRHFRRVSCFCCPLQGVNELRTLRREFPELWARMMEWERKINPEPGDKGFKDEKWLRDYDQKFAEENRQITMEDLWK